MKFRPLGQPAILKQSAMELILNLHFPCTIHSFLCANGTVFNEKSGVCDWWYNVDCTEATLSSTKLHLKPTKAEPAKSTAASVPTTPKPDRRYREEQARPAEVGVEKPADTRGQLVNANHPVLNPILIRNRNQDLLNTAGSVNRHLRLNFGNALYRRSGLFLRHNRAFKKMSN